MLRSLCTKFTLAALLAATMTVTAAPAPAQATVVAVKQCTATLTIVSQWPSGFVANITVTNTGLEPINGWIVVMQTPTGIVTIPSQPNNSFLPPGASTTFGFVASGTPTPPPLLHCYPF